MEKNKKGQKIKYKYIFSKDYNPIYVNGAYGGVTPKGEIMASFYLERFGIPFSHTYMVDEEGKLGERPIQTNPDDLEKSLVRFVQSGIVLNYRDARIIHKWLGEKIVELGKLMKLQENSEKKKKEDKKKPLKKKKE